MLHMKRRTWSALLILLAVAAALGWQVYQRLMETRQNSADPRSGTSRAIPVEVVAVEQGNIQRQRSFSGSLQAQTEMLVAPKVSGRIEQLNVDLADRVSRDQVVAQLDNDEYVQAVRQMEAELAVARTNLAEAQSQLKIAERELQRID
jgi:multidrug efflux pump subunit AcrA (membrane-fusion protein)